MRDYKIYFSGDGKIVAVGKLSFKTMERTSASEKKEKSK